MLVEAGIRMWHCPMYMHKQVFFPDEAVIIGRLGPLALQAVIAHVLLDLFYPW